MRSGLGIAPNARRSRNKAAKLWKAVEVVSVGVAVDSAAKISAVAGRSSKFGEALAQLP